MKIVLLPGLDGTGRLFDTFLPQLSPTLEPIVVSYPSDRVLTYSELFPIIEAALPTIKPYVILGESFSGPLAVMVAARKPKGLKAVILVASFVRCPVRHPLALLRPFVSSALVRLVPSWVSTRLIFNKNSSQSLIDKVRDIAASVPPSLMAARLREVLAIDVSAELQSITVPLLYLGGERDRLVSRRSATLFQKLAPHASVVWISAPHLLLQTAPVEAAAAIKSFLADHVW